ncbi:GNAT family N-acetyltransferase [Lactobacillus kalixensis]|uniref:N-acetyltransferase n=1 Tax=Lactobacillus kalixensis DSM 16043 TaxID=1423763 RepID=A0A0R1UCD5_9LACO|nr:GNAT family N-acetyltransferase [Lactobacillus kalixensis]KRL91056.1 N-acetyltransferase [Lactobacillus kalixensis DSM 16043]
MDYTIKNVTIDDLKKLQEISRETFKKTFDPFTKPDDMAEFLEESYATQKLTQEISNPDSRFFFLMVDGEVAGYLKINVGHAQTEQLRDNALEIERIYLREKFQHQGLGSVLFNYAEKIATAEKKDYLWLGVYEKNIVAQKFYAKKGLTRVSQHVYPVGDDPQIDYLLVKKLDH